METNLKLQNKTAVIGGGADSMMVEIVQYQDSDRRAGWLLPHWPFIKSDRSERLDG